MYVPSEDRLIIIFIAQAYFFLLGCCSSFISRPQLNSRGSYYIITSEHVFCFLV